MNAPRWEPKNKSRNNTERKAVDKRLPVTVFINQIDKNWRKHRKAKKHQQDAYQFKYGTKLHDCFKP